MYLNPFEGINGMIGMRIILSISINNTLNKAHGTMIFNPSTVFYVRRSYIVVYRTL